MQAGTLYFFTSRSSPPHLRLNSTSPSATPHFSRTTAKRRLLLIYYNRQFYQLISRYFDRVIFTHSTGLHKKVHPLHCSIHFR
jgi:hypothetical protein